MEKIPTLVLSTRTNTIGIPIDEAKKFLFPSKESEGTHKANTSIIAAQLAFEEVHWWSNVVRYLKSYVVLPDSPNATTQPASGKYIDCQERIPLMNCSEEYAEFLRECAPTEAEIEALSNTHGRLQIAGNDIVFWHYIRWYPKLQHPFWHGLFEAYEIDRKHICKECAKLGLDFPSQNALNGLSHSREKDDFPSHVSAPNLDFPHEDIIYTSRTSPEYVQYLENRIESNENLNPMERPDTYGLALVYALLLELHHLRGSLDEFLALPKAQVAQFMAYVCRANPNTMYSFLPPAPTKEIRPSGGTQNNLSKLLESVGIDNVNFCVTYKDVTDGILSDLLNIKLGKKSPK